MDIGGVKPGYHEGEPTRIWRCPIEVYYPNGDKLDVINIYVEEGTLCIDVEKQELPTMGELEYDEAMGD